MNKKEKEIRQSILNGEFQKINIESFMNMENKEEFLLLIGFDDRGYGACHSPNNLVSQICSTGAI